jgi:glucokinase
MEVCLGVDLGGTWIKFGLFDTAGTLLEKWEIPTPAGTLVFQTISNGILKAIKDRGIHKSKVVGVGLGVPGPVDDEGHVEVLVNLHLRDMNVAQMVSDLLGGISVIATNDANLAALGETWRGAGRGRDHAMLITLGTGVGSGLVIGGRLVNGSRGLAGEIGHIVVNPDETEFCNCGAKGCLDQVASATGLVRYCKKFLQTMDKPKRSVLSEIPNLTAENIIIAAEQGDRLATETLNYTMRFLAKTIVDVSQVVDPEIFIIGGGLSNAGDFLLDIITKHYNELSIFSRRKTGIVLAELGNDAGIFGAARLALKEGQTG